MIKYTLHTDESWPMICAPLHVGQVVELIEQHTTLSATPIGAEFTVPRTLRYVAVHDSQTQALRWERVPLPTDYRRKP